jgi:hypothetical protein
MERLEIPPLLLPLNLLYLIFITQDRVIKMAEVAGGTEERFQMCRYTGLLLARKPELLLENRVAGYPRVIND